eukprot:gene10137-12859_t
MIPNGSEGQKSRALRENAMTVKELSQEARHEEALKKYVLAVTPMPSMMARWFQGSP